LGLTNLLEKSLIDFSYVSITDARNFKPEAVFEIVLA